MYRILRIDPNRGHNAKNYTRALLGFSLASVLVLTQCSGSKQCCCFGNAREDAVEPWMAFNTAASFTSNTNWQSYSGEDTLTNASQMLGLTVQNFASAAVGMCVAVALIRGIGHLGYDRDTLATENGQHLIGNFWVDLTRGLVRILLPLSLFISTVLVLGGTMQTFGSNLVTESGVDISRAPVASQEAIKPWVPTAVASSVPTLRTRLRTRPALPTWWRSSLCLSSLSA